MHTKRLVVDILSKLGLTVPAGYAWLLLKPHQWSALIRNAWQRGRSEIDGFPVPPAHLRILISGTLDVDVFLNLGKAAMNSIRTTLGRNGLTPDRFRSVLDFGCGVGRVIRYWPGISNAALHGSDYNPRLIEWNRNNLGFASFGVNGIEPPLRYADNSFDFIYALSVFTHLPERLQHAWMQEMYRVLEPRGSLLITTHGDYYLDRLYPDQRERFEAGELIVKNENVAGSNFCNAYHPEDWVRAKLARGFVVVDFIPKGAKGNPEQDIFLLRKPPAGGTDISRQTDDTLTQSESPGSSEIGITYTHTRQQPLKPEVLARNLVVTGNGRDPVTLAYKMLRTQVFQRMEAGGWNVLAVTSPGPGEGKTLTALNLAISLAREVNHTVLLVELDLSQPSLHEYLGYEPGHGITDYLLRDMPLQDIMFNPGIDRLVVIPAGPPAAFSSELLSSPRMVDLVRELKERYPSRLVLFDLPPLLSTDDGLAFLPHVDAALLVVAEGQTSHKDVEQAKGFLDSTHLMGTVLNRSNK